MKRERKEVFLYLRVQDQAFLYSKGQKEVFWYSKGQIRQALLKRLSSDIPSRVLQLR